MPRVISKYSRHNFAFGTLHKVIIKTINLLSKLSLNVAAIVNLISVSYTRISTIGMKGQNKMIVTVTMNPAIDKTVEVEELICRGLNRIRKVEYDAGGKGINVSKTINELGGHSVATGFLGGNNGQVIASVLKEKGIACDFVWVSGETRTNTKVVEDDGSLTELNELGPMIDDKDICELKSKLLGYADKNTMFIFAGSIPAGVPKDIYGKLIRLVKSRGACVLLDADGEVFYKSVEAGPDIIKPNQVELEEYFGLQEGTDANELIRAAQTLEKKGVKNIVVSMGKSGALFLLEDYKARCPGLSIKAHSAVGAGDAMVAALAYAWDHQLEKEETVKLCMAASAGAVATIGTKPPSRKVVDDLMKQVKIERIGE